jgi:uncharacterized coiled-coil protein SlyX
LTRIVGETRAIWHNLSQHTRKDTHTMNPRPSSRISSLEKRATTIEAAIEELSSDQAEELKAIRQDIKQGHIDIGKALDSHADSLMQEIRTRFDSADQRLTTIEATMATKEDISNLEIRIRGDMICMETRIIDTFTRLLQQKSGE